MSEAPPAATPSRTPTIDGFGRDVTLEVGGGEAFSVLGREREIDQVVEVLCRRDKRNPVLVGPPGVGKGSIVMGLAQRFAGGEVPTLLQGTRVIELRVSELQANATPAILAEMATEAVYGRVVFAFDRLDQADYWGMLEPLAVATDNGLLASMGALDPAEFNEWFGQDRSLARRFEPVRVDELDAATTERILGRLVPRFAGADVQVDVSILAAIIAAAERHLGNRYYPEKAIDLLDRTIARARRLGVRADAALVADVIADMTGAPAAAAAGKGPRMADLREHLLARVIGQDDAIATLSRWLAIKLRGLDLRPERPNGVFMFTGPTGVGKTETARALAEFLFGSPDRMLRIDMSEYAQEHHAASLLGAPPGYIGFESGAPVLSQLAERPFTVVLLDEIEKAHPTVHRLFLQAFDAGFLTSAAGRKFYFSDAVVIMTSNIGAAARNPVGFVGTADEGSSSLDALDRWFAPEFVNRIDAVCRFRPLDLADVRRILERVTIPVWAARHAESGIRLEFSDAALDLIATAGFSPELGARSLNRAFEEQVIARVVELVSAAEPAVVEVDAAGGRLTVTRK